MDSVLQEIQRIAGVINSFYLDLFKPNGSEGLKEIFLGWNRRITQRQYGELEHTYTVNEVNITLSQMAPSKAPDPDGLPPDFFKIFLA